MCSKNQLSICSPNTVGHNWQDTKTTIRDRIAFLFNKEILSDVTFLVGKGTERQSIPAHKLILCSGSVVFDAMFNGPLATASSEIEVPDVEPASFLEVLLFLYTDGVQLSPETVTTTLYAAKKYAVSILVKHCIDFLRKSLTSDNAFLLLTQAQLFDEPQLVAACLNKIDKFTTKALNGNGFTDIDIDTLIFILKRDTLYVRELTIFEAVVRWSEAECLRQQLQVTPNNQRLVLDNALSFIRFRLMSRKEFVTNAAQSGLLKYSEVLSFYSYFHSISTPISNIEPRCCEPSWIQRTVCRISDAVKPYTHRFTAFQACTRFTVNRSIVLLGYGVYISNREGKMTNDVIELIHTDSGETIALNKTSSKWNNLNFAIQSCFFQEAVEILPNTSYTASVKLKKPVYAPYEMEYVSKISVTDPESKNEIITFEFSDVYSNSNETFIAKGKIAELIFDI